MYPSRAEIHAHAMQMQVYILPTYAGPPVLPAQRRERAQRRCGVEQMTLRALRRPKGGLEKTRDEHGNVTESLASLRAVFMSWLDDLLSCVACDKNGVWPVLISM